ncbi:carbonate dehydratase [Neoconidiobolus thromboides FSU 785]|nr:carbonate dehydratase [Neoconidiobolus thromboides FSU 785]
MEELRYDLVQRLLKGNTEWAARKAQEEPDLFEKLSSGQQPKVLFIGCSDSRVPASEIFGAKPGELFVLRNIANVISPGDLSALCVIQYSVEVLKVEHIFVCGHRQCGGVLASLSDKRLGLIDSWLQCIREVQDANREELLAIDDEEAKINKIIELNVQRSMRKVALTSFVQDAWKQGRNLSIHGFVYDLKDGIVKELGFELSSQEQCHNFKYQV